jgi:hypothetical protein
MKSSNRYRLIPASVSFLAAFSSLSFADSYQVQIDLDGFHSDADLGAQQETYRLRNTFYFKTIETAQAIYQEAAFLNKASSIALSVANNEETLSSIDDSCCAWGVDGKYILSERFIFQAAYNSNSINGVDETNLGLGAGFYINDTTSFVVGFTQKDIDDAEKDFNTTSISLKSVIDVDGEKTAVGDLTASVSENVGANTVIELDGSMDYYFTPRFSLGGRFAASLTNNGNDTNTYGIQARYFIADSFSVGASFATTIFQEEDDTASIDNTDTFTLTLTGRL